MHNKPVFRGTLYSGWQSYRLRWSIGASSVVELGNNRTLKQVGYGRHWFGETNGWMQVAYRGAVFEITLGLLGTSISLGERSQGFALERESNAELYLKAQLIRSRFNPSVSFWHQVTPRSISYLQTEFPFRIPLWNLVLFPIGSVTVSPMMGWYLEPYNVRLNESTYQLNSIGFWGISSSFVIGNIPLGPAQTFITLQGQWLRGIEDAIKFTNAADQAPSKWSLSISWLTSISSF